MPDILPVSDEDVVAAFRAMYTTEVSGTQYTAPLPNATDPLEILFLQGLKKALENDRHRVIERVTA